MNRLEEELRRALAREEPPPGFAERVMSAIEDRRRKKFSTRLFGFLGLTTADLKWGVACAVALIVLVTALVSLRNNDTGEIKPDGPRGNTTAAAPSPPEATTPEPTPAAAEPRQVARRQKPRHSNAVPVESTEPGVTEEGRVAKEKLLLALQIASSTLSEAQRMVRGLDQADLEPDPRNNR